MSGMGLSRLRTQQQLLWVLGEAAGEPGTPCLRLHTLDPAVKAPALKEGLHRPRPPPGAASPQAAARAAGGGFGTQRLFMHQPSPPAFQLNPEDFGDIMAQLYMCYYVEEREEKKKQHTKQIFQM